VEPLSEQTIVPHVDHARVPSLQPSLASVYWLELLRDANLLSEGKLSGLLQEANELTAIFTAGRRSSSRNQTSNLKHQT
jgi:hypothetical protein